MGIKKNYTSVKTTRKIHKTSVKYIAKSPPAAIVAPPRHLKSPIRSYKKIYKTINKELQSKDKIGMIPEKSQEKAKIDESEQFLPEDIPVIPIDSVVVLTPIEDFQDYNHQVDQEKLPTISQINPPADYPNLDWEVT